MLRILKRSSPISFDYIDLRLGAFRIHWFFDWDTRFVYIYWKEKFWMLLPFFVNFNKTGGSK